MSTTELEPRTAVVGVPSLTRRERWIDLVLVLGVALWQPIFASAVVALHPAVSSQFSSNTRAANEILVEFAGLAVLAWVLWKRKASVPALTVRPGLKDLWRALGLFVAGVVLFYGGCYFMWFVWPAPALHTAHQAAVSKALGMQISLAWLVFMVVNPIFEELIVRGLLITEVKALAGTSIAVVASTLAQVSYHLYQGPVNCIALGCVFLVFSLYYARTRRLLPVVLAHMAMDFLALAVNAHYH